MVVCIGATIGIFSVQMEGQSGKITYLYLIIECPQTSNGNLGPSWAPVSKFTNSELFVLDLFPEPPTTHAVSSFNKTLEGLYLRFKDQKMSKDSAETTTHQAGNRI